MARPMRWMSLWNRSGVAGAVSEEPGRSVRPVYDLRAVGKKAGEARILKDLTFQVLPGEFCGITGPSGAGKSTLLNILGAIDTYTDGAVFFRGVPLMLTGRPRDAVRQRRSIGFVFQSFHLLPRLSVLDNVALPLSLRRISRPEAVARVREALRSVNLPSRAPAGDREVDDFLSRFPATLSGGEQQRVAIARALVSGPEVILADEPTGNLDTRNSGDVLDVLASIHTTQKITVLLVTHSDQALEHCRRILRLRDGELVEDIHGPSVQRPRAATGEGRGGETS